MSKDDIHITVDTPTARAWWVAALAAGWLAAAVGGLAHPQCVCTRASVGELAEALARAGTTPKTYVVFLKPSSFADGWEKTGSSRRGSSLDFQ